MLFFPSLFHIKISCDTSLIYNDFLINPDYFDKIFFYVNLQR